MTATTDTRRIRLTRYRTASGEARADTDLCVEAVIFREADATHLDRATHAQYRCNACLTVADFAVCPNPEDERARPKARQEAAHKAARAARSHAENCRAA